MAKLHLFLILLISIQWSAEEKADKTSSTIKNCKKQFNITVNDREDPRFDCMVNCFLTGMGFVDKKGLTNINKYRKFTGHPIEFLDEEYIHFCESVYHNYTYCTRIHRSHLCILNYLYKN